MDCTKLQSLSERPTDLLATEFIVTIWPTQQNAQGAFNAAEKNATQNPVSSDEVNKLRASGFKPSFYQADDRKGFTAAYTSPDEKPEIGPNGRDTTTCNCCVWSYMRNSDCGSPL